MGVQIISNKNAYKDFKQITSIKLVVCSHVNVMTLFETHDRL